MWVINSNSFEPLPVPEREERLLRRFVDALRSHEVPIVDDVHDELPDVEPDEEGRRLEEERRRRRRRRLRRALGFLIGSASPSFKPSQEQIVLMQEPCRCLDLLRRDRLREAWGKPSREGESAGCGIIRNSSATFSSIWQHCCNAFATLAAGAGDGYLDGGRLHVACRVEELTVSHSEHAGRQWRLLLQPLEWYVPGAFPVLEGASTLPRGPTPASSFPASATAPSTLSALKPFELVIRPTVDHHAELVQNCSLFLHIRTRATGCRGQCCRRCL
ncbi:hypothetical protein MTO96_026050 [Rhipicephalus appendiculatus]